MTLEFHPKRRYLLVPLMLAIVLGLFLGMALTTETALADDDHWHGIVAERPDDELNGSWIIGERTFDVSEDTVFFFWHGPLDVGSCAAVIFDGDDGNYDAVQIASSEMSWCDDDGDGSDNEDDAGNDDDEEDDHEDDDDIPRPPPEPVQRAFGLIEVLPTNMLSGTWQIDGESYRVNNETELEDDHGPLEVGACVKVKYRAIDNERVAKEVESERAYRCNSGNSDNEEDEVHEGHLYATIITVPVDLIGEWNIGGIAIMADAETEFDQERIAFDVDVVVKVEFFTDADGVHHATEIESRFAWGHDDDEPGDDEPNDDDDRPVIARRGHAYGLIEDLPENSTMGPIGTWMIGGLPYQVRPATRLNNRHGDFGAGVRVRVKYWTDANGNRVAFKIKTTRRQPVAPEEVGSYLFSFVEVMPTASFSGTWQIGNVVLETTENSRFDERWGLLAIGSFVMVEYSSVEETNYIDRVKVLIPPGAGEHNHRGRIERIGAPVSGAMLSDDDELWMIGGSPVLVTEATQLDEVAAVLDVGVIAEVNSYTGEDGVQVATLIRGVEEPVVEDDESNRIYLPFMMNR